MRPAIPGQGGFAKWIFTDWRGAYDIAALAKSVDLVCLMTYDQQTRWTMPGPVAGWQWTVDNLNYALQFVPKEKLSLGIPLYGYHWYTGAPTEDKSTGEDKPNPTADYIGTPDALQLATPTTASSSGTPSTTPNSSGSTATRCASGSSSPTCTPSKTATNWCRKMNWRLSGSATLRIAGDDGYAERAAARANPWQFYRRAPSVRRRKLRPWCNFSPPTPQGT